MYTRLLRMPPEIVELRVNCRDSLLEHAAMSGRGGPAEVRFGAPA